MNSTIPWGNSTCVLGRAEFPICICTTAGAKSSLNKWNRTLSFSRIALMLVYKSVLANAKYFLRVTPLISAQQCHTAYLGHTSILLLTELWRSNLRKKYHYTSCLLKWIFQQLLSPFRWVFEDGSFLCDPVLNFYFRQIVLTTIVAFIPKVNLTNIVPSITHQNPVIRSTDRHVFCIDICSQVPRTSIHKLT